MCGNTAEVSGKSVSGVRWSVTHRADETAVFLVGELDLAGASGLGAALTEVIAHADRVVIDLGRLSFLDSSGINCLLAAAHTAESAGCELVARNATGIVARVLSISGVDDLLLEACSDGKAVT